MNVLNCRHIYFVPNKLVKKPTDDNGLIFVFTSRNNNKNYKKKRFECGIIFYDKRIKQWVFYQDEVSRSFCFDTLMIIAQLINKLNNNIVKYHQEEAYFEDFGNTRL